MFRALRLFLISLCALLALVSRVQADEIWITPTTQADTGGLGIASNVVWPVTPIGAVRLAWGVPNDLQTFQAAKVVLIPHAGGAATLNVIICGAQNGAPVIGSCVGPLLQPFVGVLNQLQEVDISAIVGPRVGAAGLNNLAVLAYTTPTTLTDHIVGMRFAYERTPPANVATLGANTFTGTQTAPAFVGDGSGLTNLPAPSGVATLGANTFTGIQIAPAFAGNGSGVTNVNAHLFNGLDSSAFAPTIHGHDVSQVSNAAKLAGGNTFIGTQFIDLGNLDLDPTSQISKNGVRFLHNEGVRNTFLGENSGGLGGTTNTGIGYNALTLLVSGVENTAVGANALVFNASGHQNTAVGSDAMAQNNAGSQNTAVGTFALKGTAGSRNTSIGYSTLPNNFGADNVAVGFVAGGEATSGSNNIYLGANVLGVSGESNTMYLGRQGIQTKTVIAGIRGTSVSGGEMVVIDPDGRLGSTSAVTPGADSVGSAQVIDNSLTANDLGPNSVGDSEVAFNYAASSAKGGAASNLACVACVDASEVSFGYAGTGANTFAGAQTIDGGNLDLDSPSSAGSGTITKDGVRFLYETGGNRTFLGMQAGSLSTTAIHNTGVGTVALSNVTTGEANTALGSGALSSDTEGGFNTATGVSALYFNGTGNDNTAMGWTSLLFNTTGSRNTASGRQALEQNTTGDANVALGYLAGSQATTGSNNIYLGANVTGVAGESNAIYIGSQGTQSKAVVAGIRGTPVSGGEIVVVDANGRLGSTPISGPGPDTIGSMQVIDNSLTSNDLAPGSVGASELAADSVTADKVAFNYAASATESGAASSLACSACVDATEVSFSFAGGGPNTFTGTQTINSGNLDLDDSTATTGLITKNGTRFLHNYGTQNMFVGVNAGNFTMTGILNTGTGAQALAANGTGIGNTAIGASALGNNTAGIQNTATGLSALAANTTGNYNTATGRNALGDNSTGSENTATGLQALTRNTTACCNTATGMNAMRDNTVGAANVAIGHSAMFSNTTGANNTGTGAAALLVNTVGAGNTANGSQALQNTTGSNNVAVGIQAGFNATTGNSNIYLGSFVEGVAGESNTMYLGKVGTQTKTLIAGVRGITTGVADAIPVVIDSNGQLGTVSSSRRFKEDIRDMADASDRLFKLHPVTFRYAQAYSNGSKPVQFGLIAEEVAEVFPELAVRSANGEIETVHYETLNVLLLNEVQKQQQRIEALEQQVKELVDAIKSLHN